MRTLFEERERQIEELMVKLDEARAELKDWRDGAIEAAAEPCAGAWHCTCVPGLRRLLAEAKERTRVRDARIEKPPLGVEVLRFGVLYGWECRTFDSDDDEWCDRISLKQRPWWRPKPPDPEDEDVTP